MADDMIVDGATYGDIKVGDVIQVPDSDQAGLLVTSTLYVRPDVIELWKALDESSCVVQGAPGVGKSIAVWWWLLTKVKQDSKVLWCHFRQAGRPTYVVVSINAGSDDMEFTTMKRNDFHESTEEYAIAVMDGVRQDNRGLINELADEFHSDLEYWVSSQQVTIPKEQLKELGWKQFYSSSWTSDEIDAYAGTFEEAMIASTISDFSQTMSDLNSNPNPESYTFQEVINIKKWFFGGSARCMFGFTMQESLDELDEQVDKINDAEKVLQGLAGSRATLSVNNIIAYFPGAPVKHPLLSDYIIELLSKKLGFAAIKMFYRSTWVRDNPSVHGFVFEWDLFTQVQQFKCLTLSSAQGGRITWTVDAEISLKHFLKGEITEGSIMVRPEKWNHPEYDGFFIHTNGQGERELVAWNASEAASHSGNVHKLQVLLLELGNRAKNPLRFDRVRFIFIVPIENLAAFRPPSSLAARVLSHWRFTGFEVLGGNRTS